VKTFRDRAVAIIPARWGASRFPGKPLHPIAGKPLLQHAWERASEADLALVIIATDDTRIAEAASSFGAQVALTSPHHPSGTDRIAEVARSLPLHLDLIVNVQGDEPLVPPQLIDQIVAALAAKGAPPMVTAASPLADDEDPSDPNTVKVVADLAGRALYFSRSQIPFPRSPQPDAPTLRHHGIYGYQRAFLAEFVSWPASALERSESLEQLRALENGAPIQLVLTSHAPAGVDTPAQAAAVERLILSSLSQDPQPHPHPFSPS